MNFLKTKFPSQSDLHGNLRKFRIAFVVVSLEPGGTENYLLRFLNFLDKEVEITIVCKGGKTGSLENEYRRLGVSIEVLKLGYLNFLGISKLKKILNKSFDTVCDLTGNFGGIPMVLAKFNNVPKRVSFYRSSTNHFKSTFFNNSYNNLMKLLVYGFSTDILSNSHAAFDYFYPNNKIDKRFKVIRNGINIKSFQSDLNKKELRKKYQLPPDAFLIGHVGRWNQAKNFPTMFKVAQQILSSSKTGKKIAFVFCGRETDSEAFQKLLREHCISEMVYVLGEQKSVYEVLKCYDLFYFPSLTEGQPNALIEAMISGIPFVASNIDAIKECLPADAQSQLLSATDVESTVIKITEIINGGEANNFTEWAKKEYDSDKRFLEFKNVLVS